MSVETRTEPTGPNLTGFGASELSTAQVQAMESYLGPLADSVRALVDATIRSTIDEPGARLARALVDEATAMLQRDQEPGPAGIRYNAEGYVWHWGNAAAGLRNAVAPPLEVEQDDAGRVSAQVVLGAAYEGPPGLVHGGVAALLLDHLMGVTAAAGGVPTMTGTLTLSYRRGTPLGPIRLEGRIDRREGHKIFVIARIVHDEKATVEAEGVFIVPRWARDQPNPTEE